VKELLTRRKDFKVIVTSASMDIHLFETYFASKTLKVSGRTYPVTIAYRNYEKYKEGDKYQMVHKICKVISEEILHDTSNMKAEFKGHLLCFCSSVDEITELVRIYGERLNARTFDVFALHGKVTPADQKKVFEDTGKHKFIFASRIAETAITIDGVRVVIDPGQDIELVFDQKYKVSSMKLQEITQSSAKQRAGRSGRTGPGHCFRLYSEDNFKKRPLNKTPEIKNSSLETVVLRLKTLKIHNVLTFSYIERPDN
jgi:HrpA-like RNA helicase